MTIDLKKITTIIFDLDGTLIDSSEAVADSFNYALEKAGYGKAPAEKICALIGHPLPEMFAPFVREEQKMDRMVDLYRERYSIVYLRKTRLIDGAAEALSKLYDCEYTLAVATTKPRSFTEPILEKLGVFRYIMTVAGAEEVENLKPAPDVLLLAMDRLERKPEETLFVGDMPLDVGAARAAGIPVACVCTGHCPEADIRASSPDEVFANLPEAADWIVSGR
ncbi:MAG: HAD family hydrolase [Planctomycetota bacterium]|jgi:phosphoglycolate phosphatase